MAAAGSRSAERRRTLCRFDHQAPDNVYLATWKFAMKPAISGRSRRRRRFRSRSGRSMSASRAKIKKPARPPPRNGFTSFAKTPEPTLPTKVMPLVANSALGDRRRRRRLRHACIGATRVRGSKDRDRRCTVQAHLATAPQATVAGQSMTVPPTTQAVAPQPSASPWLPTTTISPVASGPAPEWRRPSLHNRAVRPIVHYPLPGDRECDASFRNDAGRDVRRTAARPNHRRTPRRFRRTPPRSSRLSNRRRPRR